MDILSIKDEAETRYYQDYHIKCWSWDGEPLWYNLLFLSHLNSLKSSIDVKKTSLVANKVTVAMALSRIDI